MYAVQVWAVLSDFNDWKWSSFISFPEPPTAVGKHFKVQLTAADGKVNTFTPVVGDHSAWFRVQDLMHLSCRVTGIICRHDHNAGMNSQV